ncbi:tetratricopeptide repeat protein [bacterium]|nr:tetratricopeptide repeat protein [bacterium]
MPQTIAQTKIIIPRRRPDLLSRERLTELLHELADYRLILAVAPAGYGKTSLFIDFAHQSEMSICWYAVDGTDADFSRFITYFVSTIIRRFPQLADTVLSNMDVLLNSRLTVEQIVTVVVNELYEQVHEHFLVIIDDFHLVSDIPEINEFISIFVQMVGEHGHIALLSRSLISLPDLPLMIARSYVGGLSFEELRFQKEEINHLLRHNYGVTLSEDELANLLQSTEGWITGLLLSSLRANAEISNWARLSRVSAVDLYSYLAQQVLDRQPGTTRQFLLQTSMFQEFNAALCARVLGDAPNGQTWQMIIDSVFRNNLFVLKVDDDEDWFRYHHLFQQFLQQTLLEESPEQALLIQQRTGDYYTQRSDWERAYAIFEKLRNTPALINLIKAAGPPLIRSGRYTTLDKWLEALPPEEFTKEPALISLRGTVAVNLGQVEKGLHDLNQAVYALENVQSPLDLAQTLVRRATTHFQRGNYALVLEDATTSLKLVSHNKVVPGTPASENTQALHAEAIRLQGLCFYIMGDYKAAVHELTQAKQIYAQIQDHHNGARMTLELATAHMGSGRYESAIDFFNEALESWREQHNIVGQSYVLNNMGVLNHLQGDYYGAYHRLTEALDLCRRIGLSRIEAYTLTSIGDLYADLDLPSIAIEFYERAYPLARSLNERFLLLHINLSLLLISLPMDRQQDAGIYMEAANRLISEETSPFEHGLFRLALGQHYLTCKRTEEALLTLEQAVASLAKTDHQAELARAYLFLAVAHQESAASEKATVALVSCLQISTELESRHPVIVSGHRTARSLEVIRMESQWNSAKERLLKDIYTFQRRLPELRRTLRQMATSHGQLSTAQVAKIQIRALGRGEVTYNGNRLDNSDWQTTSARELFFCFVAHDDGLTKEEVGEIFWSDSTPGQLKTRFKNAIYRLRSAVGPDAVIFENDLYFFNRTLDYEYDVEHFEDAISKAKRSLDIEAKRVALLQATALYQGDFLPEFEPAWAQLERTRLRGLYVDAMLDLGEICLAMNDPNRALDRSRLLLSDDPCLESAHRLAMSAHAQLGNRAGVARQFEQCSDALMAEFGVPPSQETEMLYDRLMA